MNTIAIVHTIGGIGLFLLGMTLLTGSLKNIAGNALKDILAKFTGGRLSAIGLGAFITTLVQSSHVTTIAAIGFVSAGLISFQNSLGVIFGANLGTTTIGWIVSLLGFKFKIGLISLPLVAVGAVLRIAAKKRLVHIGTALCGFALIFIGVDFLQEGMAGLTSLINLTSFSGATYFGRFILLIIGIVMTIIMQSSGAAVTMTLAALLTNTITLQQGAALVIGQNIGTTITAAFAGIGAITQAKRTAIAHIMFNVFTAAVAFVLLPFLIMGIEYFSKILGIVEKTIMLSAFHTIFNVLGVVLLTPFIKQFATFIEKLIPQKGITLIENLDESVKNVPPVAIEAVKRSMKNILKVELKMIQSIITQMPIEQSNSIEEIRESINQIGNFITDINTSRYSGGSEHETHIKMFHALEHIGFILEAVEEKNDDTKVLSEAIFNKTSKKLLKEIKEINLWLDGEEIVDLPKLVKSLSKKVEKTRKNQRLDVFKQTAFGEIDSSKTYEIIECLRWFDKVTYRLWRTVKYLY